MANSKRFLSAGLIAALSIAGCTPVNTTGNENRARDGAILGGILGGVLGAGADDDNRLRNAAAGAAAGAIVGGGIGTILDRQARDLEQALGNDRIAIENTGSELVVTMPQDLLFATDSATVRGDLQADLRALASNLRAYPSSNVLIIGHTDNTGEAGYNQNLSERRAQSVRTVLLNANVPASRLRAFGRGESEPVATNLTAEGRQQNRRVEIVIRPY